jgi:formylglycine-generating enzyme required for sulfatase activity
MAVIAIVILSLAFIGCKSVTKPDIPAPETDPKPALCKCDPKDHLLLGQSCDCGGENCDCSEVREITSATGIELRLIPAGTFKMGSPETEANRYRDETQHLVKLTKSFYMGKFEVTQEQYQAVMGSNPSHFTSAVDGESGTPGKLPVERVNWYDAVEFCNKLSVLEGLQEVYTISGRTPATGYPITSATVTVDWSKNGYRLPTEAEWEYACRAGTKTAYNTGATIITNTGWYERNGRSKTHKVGLKPANAWGLHDMHGNVWEWCWDRYKEDITTDNTDPTGAVTSTNRVIRGGSWLTDGVTLRSAYRLRVDHPSDMSYNLGFRVARG